MRFHLDAERYYQDFVCALGAVVLRAFSLEILLLQEKLKQQEPYELSEGDELAE